MTDREKIEPLFKTLPPQQAVQYLTQLLEEFRDLKAFREKYRSTILDHVELQGVGLAPIAVTLGGLMSIAGVIVCTTIFDSIRYIVTSPEVERGQGAFELSKKYLDALLANGYEAIIVNFSDIPKYEEANKLFEMMKRGAIVVQGVSVELAIWLGRNAGVGRIAIYRPLQGKAIIRYL